MQHLWWNTPQTLTTEECKCLGFIKVANSPTETCVSERKCRSGRKVLRRAPQCATGQICSLLQVTHRCMTSHGTSAREHIIPTNPIEASAEDDTIRHAVDRSQLFYFRSLGAVPLARPTQILQREVLAIPPDQSSNSVTNNRSACISKRYALLRGATPKLRDIVHEIPVLFS